MTDKQTATERLRQLLDERGVESGYPHTLRPELHRALDAAGIDYWVAQGLTFWNCFDGRECVAYGYQANGKPKLAVKIVGITDPEQAVEATLGRDRYSYEQWREISNAVGDAMEYAHDRAIEHPDAADPLWNLDEYVNRIIKVAFEGETTTGRGTCKLKQHGSLVDQPNMVCWSCSECGFGWHHSINDKQFSYCPNCGAKVVGPTTNDVGGEVD